MVPGDAEWHGGKVITCMQDAFFVECWISSSDFVAPKKSFLCSSNAQAHLFVPSEENKVFTYSSMFHPNQTRAFPWVWKISVWCLFSHYCWFLWHKHSSNIGLCFDTFKSPPICWELPMKSSGPDARVEEAGQYHNYTCLLKIIEHAYDCCWFVIQPLWGPQFFAFCFVLSFLYRLSVSESFSCLLADLAFQRFHFFSYHHFKWNKQDTCNSSKNWPTCFSYTCTDCRNCIRCFWFDN